MIMVKINDETEQPAIRYFTMMDNVMQNEVIPFKLNENINRTKYLHR